MVSRTINTGADALVKALEDLGVQCVFGLPGSQNVALFESLRLSGIRTVLTASETAAGFMANGWCRASGQPGVFMGIAGPGFAWAVPPMAEAAHDSAAIILITPKPSSRGYKHDLQVLPQQPIADSLGCIVIDIDDAKSIVGNIKDAWSAARNSGPRPVLVQVNADILKEEVKASDLDTIHGDTLASETPLVLVELAERWKQAERPVVFAGAGTLDYADQLLALVEKTGSAVFTTPTARGVIPEIHPLCLRADLLSDSVGALNDFLNSADFIVALGCRLSHNGTGGFRLALAEDKLAHIDLDEQVLDANYPARWTCCMDVGVFLGAISSTLDGNEPKQSATRLHASVDECRNRLRSSRGSVRCEPVWAGQGSCRELFAHIAEAIGNDGILVTDTGLHQILTRTHLDALSPRGLIFPSDFQSMGFGLPAAIGAALANPDRPVTALVGDGGLLMVGAELATAAREALALPVLVFRDGYLGQIRMQQLENYGYGSATQLSAYDLSAYSRSLGAEYVLGSKDLAEQIRTAHTRKHPTVIEIQLVDNESLDSVVRRVRRKTALKSAIGPGFLRILRKLR